MKPSWTRWALSLSVAIAPLCAFGGEVLRCPDTGMAAPHDAATLRKFNQAARQAPRLFRAIQANDVRAAKRYLALGDDPNACALGASLLSQAVAQGHMAIAADLLRAGASLDHPLNSAGETVLLHTIGEAQLDRAADLIVLGADVKAKVAGITPLLAASAVVVKPFSTRAREQLDLVRLLLVRGAGVNAQAPDGATALMLAVRNGNATLIRLLLFFGADPLLRDHSGVHALRLVQDAKRGDIEAVLAPYVSTPDDAAAPIAALIEAGRNDELTSLLSRLHADKVAYPGRQALLVTALVQHNLQAIAQLARWGADPNGVMEMTDGLDPVGMTPLQLAIGYDMGPEVLEALGRAGADPNRAVELGDDELPLMMALTRHNLTAARTLLRLGADPNRTRAAGDMPALTIAVALADLPELDNPMGFVQQLLDRGANPNAIGSFGMTPLHMAAIDGNAALVRQLLAHGADPNVRDDRHNTALDYARQAKAAELVTMLKPMTHITR
ncbi:ankyrin repeat domain-containing protein [Ralstonia syzygii subsp. celebesensis]|uniref:Uncharacterized protein n=2 Tax=Ralstonia syzygii subsp. celebesensis TaxID=1310168 RepID=A0A1U9VEG8_9RALS|nr:ankyrin repeat domain-containing protein [Ralstonia syzygii]AQW29072.1 hypothetical protein B0B51_02910 [blood disease bacterium A2-HR MARDI]QQV54385.1 ankyrin repeat domain-containing protein [Ralstonia syzygii subsp. celebesensis]